MLLSNSSRSWFWIFCISGWSATMGQVDDVQRRELASLFAIFESLEMNSTFSRPLHDWFQDDDYYCSFEGVACDENQEVVMLTLAGMQLAGTLPSNLQNLPQLGQLVLGHNAIGGGLPISLPPNLFHLNLQHNHLTGVIPEYASDKLKQLVLSNNLLEGSIPPSLCNISHLQTVIVSNNVGITGTLPTCLEDSTELQSIQIRDTSLIEPIPGMLCGPEVETGMCHDLQICRQGYHHYDNSYYNTTTCILCETPSNVIASSSCRWVQDSVAPSSEPSGSPSYSPSSEPSQAPTATMLPTISPSTFPSYQPTATLSSFPSDMPSLRPSEAPSTNVPSFQPSDAPSLTIHSSSPASPIISKTPSYSPSLTRTVTPSFGPSWSAEPTNQPSSALSATGSQVGPVAGIQDDSLQKSQDSAKRKNSVIYLPMIVAFCFGAVVLLYTIRRRRNRFYPVYSHSHQEGSISSSEQRLQSMEDGGSIVAFKMPSPPRKSHPVPPSAISRPCIVRPHTIAANPKVRFMLFARSSSDEEDPEDIDFSFSVEDSMGISDSRKHTFSASCHGTWLQELVHNNPWIRSTTASVIANPLPEQWNNRSLDDSSTTPKLNPMQSLDLERVAARAAASRATEAPAIFIDNSSSSSTYNNTGSGLSKLLEDHSPKGQNARKVVASRPVLGIKRQVAAASCGEDTVEVLHVRNPNSTAGQWLEVSESEL